MKFSLEKFNARLPELRDAARREVIPLAHARIDCAPIARAHEPDFDDSAWPRIASGDRWGGPGVTCWLRIPIHVPDSWEGQRVAVHLVLGAYTDLSGPEALLYLDGVPVQGIDFYHREFLLGDRVSGGQKHMLALEAYSSLMPGPQTIGALELVRLDAEADGLYHDIRVLLGALEVMDPDALERATLLRSLERAYQALDLRQPHSEQYLQSVTVARAILAEEAFGRGRPERQPRIVAVGHAHIDLAWLWPVAQTRRKGARTFSTVLKLMDQHPAYHFVATQPALYQMVREDEPSVYALLKERIAQGRWEPTGATWVEMDCNLTGAEALVRQFTFGKRFFRQELGVDPKILWLPDVFGYAAALPQIIAGCGAAYFMTTKISWNEYNRLPYDTFRWRGIDGTEVLTHMVTAPLNPGELAGSTMQPFYTYNAKFTPYDVAGDWDAYRQKDINDELLYLFGYGDGGGGPTTEMQETATRLAGLPGFPHVAQGSAEEFFQRLHERVWDDPDLPTWVGELYLEFHRGTYTSQGWIKRANRHAELLYREAELWSASAGALYDAAAMQTRQGELNRGWETILFNQFHDILPGSSITQVYADARADFHAVFARGTAVRSEAVESIAAAVSTEEAALLVFNPAPFERDDPVELVLPDGAAVPIAVDGEGRPLAVQELEAYGSERHVLVGAAAPALGYHAWTVRPGDAAPRDADQALQVTRDLLENRFFRLHLDEHGHIDSLYDKRARRDVIVPGEVGNSLIAFEDRPHTEYNAWDIGIYYNDKPYPVDDVTSWRVVETGPLRGGVEIVRRFGSSVITQRILLHADVPRIDFPTHVDWREQQTLLKVAFPVTVNSPRATFEIQWGNVERPTHWNTSWDWARFETCAHKWIDLSEGDYGVSLLNDCKYGHDVRGHTMRLTLIKSAVWPDPTADQGLHEFSYALLPHQGDWRAGETVRHAYLFNMPASARLVPRQDGALPPSTSLISTSRPGLVIETIKPAEDGDGIIVRVYDAHNTRGRATLTFARDVVGAVETNMLEEMSRPVEYSGRDLHFDVRPFEIKTFRVHLGSS